MTRERSVREGGRTLWLLDEPAADATWDPGRGVLVVHRVGGEEPDVVAARVGVPAREMPGGLRVELEVDAPLQEVRATVAQAAAGDPWRDRACWVCGEPDATLGRPTWGRTSRTCMACALLVAEEAALRPSGMPADVDDDLSLSVWAREDAVARLGQVQEWSAAGSDRHLVALVVRSAVPLLGLPLWRPWMGQAAWAVLGLWALTAVGALLGPPWLPVVTGALALLTHLAQWPLALGMLRGPRGTPGRPRRVLPDLFAVVDAAATELGVRPVDRVQLVDDATVVATEQVYDNGPARVVVIGRAALEVLGREDLRVLVALALASVEEERSWVPRLADAWTERWHHVALVAEDARGGGPLGRYARVLLPELVAARAAVRRARVVPADRRVAQRLGAEAVARALTRQHLLHTLLATTWWAAARRWALEGRAGSPRLGPFLREGLEELPPAWVERMRDSMAHEVAPWWEIAPRLGTRLELLGVAVLHVGLAPSTERVSVPSDHGLERLDGWLLQAGRLGALRVARAMDLLQRHRSDDTTTRLARTQLRREVGDEAGALGEVEAVLAEAPHHGLAHRLRLELLLWHGSEDAVVAAAAEALAVCRDRPALQACAEILRRAGRLAEADAALRVAAERARTRAERSLLELERTQLSARPDPPPVPGSPVPASR